MSDVVIRAEGLGKKYVIGQQGESERYTSLRDVLARGARGFAKYARDLMGGKLPLRSCETIEDFWALKDVSFEIKRGEVVGFIGRNGAGKSTLLKILSRITEPTEGRLEIKGRAASLLEVGTGFHPELTGRENIYLNGSILGMSRAEIRRKFDEIVAFAEVEKFLDTPVKRYSSGMYVRLAFAVAAHLEPEILIVDEVLAVGDAEFQKKCLGKMGEIAGQGRTVLFVSHNMSAVQRLCNRGFVLTRGLLTYSGPVSLAVQHSQAHMNDSQTWIDTHDHTGNSFIRRVEVCEGCPEPSPSVELAIEICSRVEKKLALEVKIKDIQGDHVAFISLGTIDERELIQLVPGINRFVIGFSVSCFARGTYRVGVSLVNPMVEIIHEVVDAVTYNVEPELKHPAIRAFEQNWSVGSIQIEGRLLRSSCQIESRLN